jgi:hypothetical protein
VKQRFRDSAGISAAGGQQDVSDSRADLIQRAAELFPKGRILYAQQFTGGIGITGTVFLGVIIDYQVYGAVKSP